MNKKYYSYDEIVDMLKTRYIKEMQGSLYSEISNNPSQYTFEVHLNEHEYISIETIKNPKIPLDRSAISWYNWPIEQRK